MSDMWNEIQSVSGSITTREKPATTRVRHSRGKVNKVKVAWLSPPLAKTRQLRRNGKLHVLLEQLKFYCENSSLAGYKYITEVQRTWFERIMWIVLHLIMIYALGVIVWKILQDYYHTPVVTVVESDHYPSNFLELPAVSVCSINRISRKAAVRLVENIKSTEITNMPFDKILSLLRELGNLYESSFDVEHKNQVELDVLLKKYFRGSYELTQLMKELTPQCNDIFVKCSFRSEIRNCSELFSFRKTQDGFCCTFNYARETDDVQGPKIENTVKSPYKIERFGMLNGLTFLMEPFLDDYFFPILPVNGWKITIFNPGDYPDNTSGGVSDALISTGTENFLELNAVSFFSEKSVRRFDVEDRKCIFNDEISALYDGYTYSDCIVDCKVSDMWNTCGCRPFYYPKRDMRRVCNTSDVECLHKYKSKWWSVLPHDIKQGGEESKIFNFISNESWSLRCKNCYPSCDDVHYYLQTSSVMLEKEDHKSFLKDVNIVNQSLIHIFFSKYGTVRLKQDIAYYWYELLSNIGGICGVFIGFSLISAVEFVYFIVLSGATLWRGMRRDKTHKFNDNGFEVTETVSNDVRPLYWAELAPRGKAAAENGSRRRTIVR